MWSEFCSLFTVGRSVSGERGMPLRVAGIASRAVVTAAALAIGLAAPAAAAPVEYSAATGQTATAAFSFPDSTHLIIVLRETTLAGASALTGDAAILTTIGFLLPGSAVIVLPGSVNACSVALCGTDSASVGFSTGIGPGGSVSAEWGATIGGEQPIGNGRSYDYVSVLAGAATQFAGVNRDGDTTLGGAQGGLLDDSAAAGGLGVIDSSVRIVLTVDANPSTTGVIDGLTPAQQTEFLNTLSPETSIVKWGSASNYSGGDPVATPEPGTLLLLGSGLTGLGALVRRRRRT
jgi:hypothetical protein